MAKNFAVALQAELEKAEITAYRLSKLTGISTGMISQLLSNKQQPGWETVVKICKVLNVPCTVFQPEEVELPEPSEDRGRGRPKQATEEAAGETETESEAGDGTGETEPPKTLGKPPARKKRS